MGQYVDNLIAFRILYLLTTSWEKTDAFKLGIIDKDGKLLKSVKDLSSSEEKDAYNYLTRLVFNLKRIINKAPGGKSILGSLVAAYFLIKEGIEQGDLTNLEERFEDISLKMDEGYCLVEEQLLVEQFLSMFEEAPTNSVGGGGVANPVRPIGAPRPRNNWKDMPKKFGVTSFEISDRAYNGYRGAKAKGKKWNDHLVPSEEDKDVYDKIKGHSKTYPNKPILIKKKGYEIYTLIK